MNIGISIKEIRKHRGISQKELAMLANTTQAALSQIESGRRPKTETLKKISEALGIPESIFYLIGLEIDDIPKENRHLYDEIYPLIKSLLYSLVNIKDKESKK